MNIPDERIRGLLEDAKWGVNEEVQKKSIEELGTFGPAAVASLEEIITVTSREEIRRQCMDAIKGIERKGNGSGTHRRARRNNGKPKQSRR